MTTLKELVTYSDRILCREAYQDSSINGLQVETSLSQRIRKIAYSADSGESVIKEACFSGAQLLIVHHGLFWGQSEPITGALKRKLKLLLEHNCALYASHLPLDGHLKLGNGAQLAQLIKLKKIKPFCSYKGSFVGAQGHFEKKKSPDQIARELAKLPGATKPLILSFGPKQISSVGIVTGSGAFAMSEIKALGLDLLISGEPKQECYHVAQELGINAIFCGHYATEVFGVRALSELLSRRFKLSNPEFIHVPTGI